MDQRIYGVDGRQIYGAAGSVCQMGIFCPCLGTVEFDITGTNGQLTDGRISKIFGGCGKLPQYRCRLGCILVIWVAFFSRRQRYCG